MTHLTLYHSTRCPYSRRVRLVLEELDVDYEDVEVDKQDPPDWYRELNPAGEVPTLVHGDQTLTGSATIVEYLDEVFDGDLMPEDAAQRAAVRNIVAWVDDEWMPAFHAFEKTVEGNAKDDANARADLDVHLDELESRFQGEGPYLVGRTFTLADVAVATTVTRLPQSRVSLAGHPKVESLVEAVSKRRSFRRVPTRPQTEVLSAE